MNPTANHQIFKLRAKEMLKTCGNNIYIAAAIAIGAAALLGLLSGDISIDIDTVKDLDMGDLSGSFRFLWKETTTKLNTDEAGAFIAWSTLFGWAVTCVSVLLDYGLIDYTLRVHRGEVGAPQNVLIGFNTPFRILGAHLLRQILIWLATLCFIIPGFIMAYSLRMTERLLIDHPEWSVWTCMQESRRMMRGHKFDLFGLDLSFIGWGLLEGFFKPVAIYSMPYRYLSVHGFYEALAQPAPQPEEKSNPFADGGFEEEWNER